jgi:hypothetical protein
MWGRLTGVKRTALIKRINEIARVSGQAAEWTEGGRHTKVRIGSRRSVIPRHREIPEGTARAILEQLANTNEKGES